MIGYKTVRQEITAEQIIEKSRFICHIKPVGSKEEAEVFISAIKGSHRDAAHNVPAYVLGEQSELQWASDDGEPSGTSGAPILQMLVKEGLTNVAVVVTRYFGGIKLGTGGLVRAYTSTVKLAVEASGICRYQEMAVFSVDLAYSHYGKLQNMADELGFKLKSPVFGETIAVTLSVVPAKLQELKQFLLDMTAGSCRFFDEITEMALENSKN